jgi:predicted GNAT superfamily acetyltransferase
MSTQADAADAAPPGVTIEDVADVPRLREMEELQVLVWGGGSQTVVPAHLLHVIATSGGIVLGAYQGGRLIGFVLGLLAQRDGHLYHASHMLGIHPDLQGSGIGAALKWRQRERALAQGLDLMTWTFDPLEARNAHLNLHKLGAISRTYLENAYGAMEDRLNRGLPSDRLSVEWWLRSAPPVRPSPPAATPVPILSEQSGAPLLRLAPGSLGLPLSVQAPPDIQQIKREDEGLALRWRLALRRALTWAFDRGYVIRDFVRCAYLLTRDGE